MTEPLTALTGQLATIVVGVLQQFGVAMTLRRVVTIPSDTTDPIQTTTDFPCRGVGGITTRRYDKSSSAMSRVMEITITDPGIEPRAEDRILNADGSLLAVITADAGLQAVRPDLITTVCYLITLRRI